MEINKNEVQFIREMIDMKCDIYKAMDYVNETYGVNTEYNDESNELLVESADNKINTASAKLYLDEKLSDFVNIMYK